MPTFKHDLQDDVHTIMAGEQGPGIRVDTGQKATILEVWLEGATDWVPYDEKNPAHRKTAQFPNYGSLHRIMITASRDPDLPQAAVGV